MPNNNRNNRNAYLCAASNGYGCHGSRFRRRLSTRHARAAPASAVAELGVVTTRVLKMKAIVAVLCSLLVSCANSISPSSPIPAKRLVGKWYSGTTGSIVFLTLNRDSTYEADREGCMGPLSFTRGNWKLSQTTLTLTPTEETGMLHGDIPSLDVLRYKRGYALVPPKNRKDFIVASSDKTPINVPLVCFIRTK